VKLCVNWLPVTPDLTRHLAGQVERAGLWGLGVGDSPNYGEVYAACADALGATTRIAVCTSVTNPVTRHASVHVSAARTFEAAYPGRFTLGIGRGDSAVRTFGLRPASTALLDDTLRQVRDSVPSVRLLVAASGPAAAAVAGRRADGVIAGVGADPATLAAIRAAASAGRAEKFGSSQVWASVRLAVAPSPADVPALRRAVSASHFAFSGGLDGKNVPDAFRDVMVSRYATYDYAWHGRSGPSPNGAMFADHPEIEDYLLDRFAVFGTAEECRRRLTELDRHVDGIYLSLLFEDVLEQFALVAGLFGPDELEQCLLEQGETVAAVAAGGTHA
jgi:alkanesulfonate monooxygenase SsuD/methylene tetrahydromethanopterin reductase-like flavin-dependent oxidoreductase (luciferase family)